MSENIFFNKTDLKKCGENVTIGKTVRIRNPELVEIGDNVIIDDFVYISGNVVLGDYVHIASSATLSASKSSITFKCFSGISSGVRVYAGSSNYMKACLDLPTIPEQYTYGAIYKEVILDKFCLIGANTVVLPGVELPEGTVCSANMILKPSKYTSWSVITDNKIYPRKGKDLILSQVSNFYDFENKL